MSRPRVPKITPGDGSDRHGSVAGYTTNSCRCDLCRAAWTKYRASQIEAAVPPKPGDARHGKYTTYQNYRCRCEKCKAAMTEYKRAYRERQRVQVQVPAQPVTQLSLWSDPVEPEPLVPVYE